MITYIAQEFNLNYRISNIYRQLHPLSFSSITSSSRHPKKSIEIQDNLKKFEIKKIQTMPWNVSLKSVDVWFQDEARFDQ